MSILLLSNCFWFILFIAQSMDIQENEMMIQQLKREIRHYIEKNSMDKKHYKKIIRELKRELERIKLNLAN